MTRFVMAALLLLFGLNYASATASGFNVCVLTVTSTSTGVRALADTAGCTNMPTQGAKLKVIGATPICVAGTNGASGNPASLAAGNNCYPLNQNEEFPTIVTTSLITLKTNSGTSLVSVAAADGY